ncbi:hypothetical protein QBC45DRAFT_123683 [Copromyces sp. CBS 386.78]|nr:hypothetical protein QBC45DRAFT_123683 [Copromyces sp. CBS 386.78]
MSDIDCMHWNISCMHIDPNTFSHILLQIFKEGFSHLSFISYSSIRPTLPPYSRPLSHRHALDTIREDAPNQHHIHQIDRFQHQLVSFKINTMTNHINNQHITAPTKMAERRVRFDTKFYLCYVASCMAIYFAIWVLIRFIVIITTSDKAPPPPFGPSLWAWIHPLFYSFQVLLGIVFVPIRDSIDPPRGYKRRWFWLIPLGEDEENAPGHDLEKQEE